MKTPNSSDLFDESVLRILSTYEAMTTLELWYEIGEDDAVTKRVTEAEIRARLESLREKGLVEGVWSAESDSGSPVFRITGKGQDSI